MDINTINFSHPERECDLVMKGGITSGIVYPRIVLKLAGEGKYRFRNVGGTSAGAIAAAVMAAAEFGRETGGFPRFHELSQKLAEPGFLFNLFQPSPSLKPLMYTLLEVSGKISPDEGLEHPTANSVPSEAPKPASTTTTNTTTSTTSGMQFGASTVLGLVGVLKRRHPIVAKAGAQQGLLLGLGVALGLTAIASVVFYGVAAYTDTDLSIWAAVFLAIVLGIPLGWLGYTLGILGFGAIDLVKKLLKNYHKTISLVFVQDGKLLTQRMSIRSIRVC
ncbi:MAG: hypothetical protein HC772_18180 [Leptolyngbyaceae cyanobacterium CRU_2_3]|nr:hypothetical protein [Leptolyngbyaceae cyanobacterium CRU_2_3]